MRILIFVPSRIPVTRYGGTQRVAWWLGKYLVRAGHRVTFLAKAGSLCPFAPVIPWVPKEPIGAQIPDQIDICHFHTPVDARDIDKPYVQTIHGNSTQPQQFHPNSIFLSEDHAHRHGAERFVYNGLDPEDYPGALLVQPKDYVHFLGKADWRVKNLKGALDVSEAAGRSLVVLGGNRFSLSGGWRFTTASHARFRGMVGGTVKTEAIRHSSALLFPVRWHEPFGLAVIESMYYGCPVFGTPYGALPELVSADVGMLSNQLPVLRQGLQRLSNYDRRACRRRVEEQFTAEVMAKAYLVCYEEVLDGSPLHKSAPFFEKVEQELPLPWFAEPSTNV